MTIGEPGKCWLWTGSLDARGYPQAKVGGRRGRVLRVHRLVAGMFTDINGPVHHRCGNTVCLNPGHLEALSNDAEHGERHRRDVCQRGHSLLGENLYVSPGGKRHCRVCNYDKHKAWRLRTGKH
jgi:hypothetical protein